MRFYEDYSPGTDHYDIADNSTDILSNISTIAYRFSIPLLTGVDDETQINGLIIITPNPATDFIEITGAEGEVRIFDVFGRELTTPALRATPSDSKRNLRIDVSLLAPGVYFVRVGDKVEKFVKIN